MSRPARALWIEILPPQPAPAYQPRRGPRGPCGLKFITRSVSGVDCASRPARALWIEILHILWDAIQVPSRPARALWIEISSCNHSVLIRSSRGPRGPCGLKFNIWITKAVLLASRPARALWIEIPSAATDGQYISGEAREGLVD